MRFLPLLNVAGYAALVVAVVALALGAMDVVW
jgi:hypothetical protein